MDVKFGLKNIFVGSMIGIFAYALYLYLLFGVVNDIGTEVPLLVMILSYTLGLPTAIFIWIGMALGVHPLGLGFYSLIFSFFIYVLAGIFGYTWYQIKKKSASK